MNNGEPLSFASHFGVPVELGMVQSVVLESDSCVYMYKLWAIIILTGQSHISDQNAQF